MEKHVNKLTSLAGQALLFFLIASGTVFAEPSVVEKDMDGDGRKETKVYYKKNNQIDKMVKDNNADGKPDETIIFKNDAPDHGEKDANFDGKTDTWTNYDETGNATVIAVDKHKDGKPDYWRYYKNGKIYKREYDRNFDGKLDFRILEENGRLVEKQYDDNFDGKFEKIIKAPSKGSVLKVKTLNEP